MPTVTLSSVLSNPTVFVFATDSFGPTNQKTDSSVMNSPNEKQLPTSVIRSSIMIVHVMLMVTVPWIVAYFVKEPGMLLLAIATNILMMAQYLIFGTSILTFIETPDSNHSFIMSGLAHFTQTAIEDVKNAVLLINTVSPALLEISKLARILRL